MKGDKHLPLLRVADSLHSADETGALRHQELLVVVRVVVRREHHQDWPTEPTIDMVRDDAFEHRALEDTVELALVLIEVIPAHRVGLRVWLRGFDGNGLVGLGWL